MKINSVRLNAFTIIYVLLKGDPGIGKTYTMRKLIGKYYEGEADLLDYLTAKEEENPVFLWDEINVERPGAADFLIKALASPDKKGNYKGVPFQLTKNHKLVGTLNPEKFPGRHFHQALLDYAFVIYFDTPDDQFMLELICKILPAYLHEHAEIILFAYYQIKLFNTFFVTSIRDIENLTYRFAFLTRDIPADNRERILELLLNACITEFAGYVMDKDKRDAFIHSQRLNYKFFRVSAEIKNRLTPKYYYWDHKIHRYMQAVKMIRPPRVIVLTSSIWIN